MTFIADNYEMAKPIKGEGHIEKTADMSDEDLEKYLDQEENIYSKTRDKISLEFDWIDSFSTGALTWVGSNFLEKEDMKTLFLS